jgi:Bacterial Ig domain
MVSWLLMNSRRLVLLAATAGGIALLAGCSTPGSGPVAIATPNAVLAVAPPEVTVTPADHASGVALDAPVTVSSNAGSLTTVAVTRVGGAAVPGQLSTDARTWTATDGLDPGAQYQVTVTAAGAGGTPPAPSPAFRRWARWPASC